jgi:hypothetical protein
MHQVAGVSDFEAPDVDSHAEFSRTNPKLRHENISQSQARIAVICFAENLLPGERTQRPKAC